MEPNSPPTKPSRQGAAQFGQVSESVWRISGKPMTIDEFIEDQARHITAIDISVLGAFSCRLADKLKENNADEYPGLRDAVYVIVQALESPTAQHAEDRLPRWLAETGFAASYLLKRFDLIPDNVPEIGLADDALILQRVVQRNQAELRRNLSECIEMAARHRKDS